MPNPDQLVKVKSFTGVKLCGLEKEQQTCCRVKAMQNGKLEQIASVTHKKFY